MPLASFLLELDLANHYALDGHRIDWIESGAKEGRRTPEFVAVGASIEIEVECRAKTVNAGRKVDRQNFYRLFDEIDQPLVDAGASGWIEITTPGAMPATPAWRKEVCGAVVDRDVWEAGGVTLTDGTRIDVALRSDEVVRLRPVDLQREATRLLDEVAFAHVACVAPSRGGAPTNPVFIRARSAKPDSILRAIFDDLRDKKDQFTGRRAAILCCYVPEIESFESLTTGKLANMTLDFFQRHAPSHIAGVVYSSDAQVVEDRVPGRTVRSREAATLNFANPKYDEARFGRVVLPGSNTNRA